MEAPWSACKVAFDIDDTDRVWAAWNAGPCSLAGVLPAGWDLAETTAVGASGYVVVFDVDGVPNLQDGEKVRAWLRRIRAISPPRKRAA